MITLASDFGSPYPAAMKGVILQRTDARLVDVAHDFPRHDVRAAAFWLRETLPYFPAAVHCVVVDPGVGTDRDAIVLRAGGHALVAPDNGVVVPVARTLAGLDPGDPLDRIDAFVVDDTGAESSTFHGRDVFAPTAARIHEVGVDAIDSLDGVTPTESMVDLDLPDADVDGDRAEGEVLVVDDFGNVITNVPGDFPAGAREVTVNGTLTPVGQTFAAVPTGERLVTVGSHGYVECDVNRGRGDDAFSLEPGDSVRIDRC
jgi:S-adenosylmethionine hydrolase